MPEPRLVVCMKVVPKPEEIRVDRQTADAESGEDRVGG